MPFAISSLCQHNSCDTKQRHPCDGRKKPAEIKTQWVKIQIGKEMSNAKLLYGCIDTMPIYPFSYLMAIF
jgi:hypothetical protein